MRCRLLMANDTDLLTSSDSCGDTDRRQVLLVGSGMSSGAQNAAQTGPQAASSEKLDSYVANGCVTLREECADVNKALACNATAVCDWAEVAKLPQNALCMDHQYSPANGFVPTNAIDKCAADNKDTHSEQSIDVSQNYPSGPHAASGFSHTSSEFSQETFLAESAEKSDVGDSDEKLNVDDLTSCACSLQQTALADNLSGLSIVDDDTMNPTVPCDDSVVARQSDTTDSKIEYIVYESERQMEAIMQLITKDLSEPYSIYTYRYFIHNWPKLCYLAMDGDRCIGAIVCKLDRHKGCMRRGYIAMLAVDHEYRKQGIGSSLVVKAIHSMMDPVNGGCDEVVLETEITNSAALHLYEKLGFVRDKRLFRYYLNGVDALRLKLWLK